MIRIAIIHNFEESRLSYLIPRLKQLQEVSKLGFVVSESKENCNVHFSMLDFYIRSFKLKYARLKYIVYTNKKSGAWINPESLRCTLKILKEGNMGKSKALAEIEVTQKHFSAWKTFLDSPQEFLVVLESDAIIPDLSALGSFLSKLGNLNEMNFISLTWPFSSEQIGLGDWSMEEHNGYREVKIRTTNTVAGYVLSRRLAEEVLTHARGRRIERLIIVDWFLNVCFMKLFRKTGSKGCTLIPNHELIVNGSLVGEYESELQK